VITGYWMALLLVDLTVTIAVAGCLLVAYLNDY